MVVPSNESANLGMTFMWGRVVIRLLHHLDCQMNNQRRRPNKQLTNPSHATMKSSSPWYMLLLQLLTRHVCIIQTKSVAEASPIQQPTKRTIPSGETTSTVHHLRYPERQAIEYSQFMGSYTDGYKQTIPSFILDLYVTKGDLSSEALYALEAALNSFLITGLLENTTMAAGDSNVKSVNATIVSTKSITLGSGGNRDLQETGTQVVVDTVVEFRNSPTPTQHELRVIVGQMFQNVTNLIQLLQGLNQKEFMALTMIVHHDILVPTASPTTTGPNIHSTLAPTIFNGNTHPPMMNNIFAQSNEQLQVSSSHSTNVLPAVGVAIAVFILTAMFFAYRRRKWRVHDLDDYSNDIVDDGDVADGDNEDSNPNIQPLKLTSYDPNAGVRSIAMDDGKTTIHIPPDDPVAAAAVAVEAAGSTVNSPRGGPIILSSASSVTSSFDEQSNYGVRSSPSQDYAQFNPGSPPHTSSNAYDEHIAYEVSVSDASSGPDRDKGNWNLFCQ